MMLSVRCPEILGFRSWGEGPEYSLNSLDKNTHGTRTASHEQYGLNKNKNKNKINLRSHEPESGTQFLPIAPKLAATSSRFPAPSAQFLAVPVSSFQFPASISLSTKEHPIASQIPAPSS